MDKRPKQICDFWNESSTNELDFVIVNALDAKTISYLQKKINVILISMTTSHFYQIIILYGHQKKVDIIIFI